MPPTIDFTASSVELENGFFTFTGQVGGREEIIRSVQAELVREVTLIEEGV